MSEETKKVEIAMTADGPDLSTIDKMFRFADCYLQSGLTPPAFKTPQALIIAWVRARELGIPIMQALEGMSIINGRLGLMGDLALALCERSGLLEDKRVKYEGEGDNLKCTVEIKRKNREWKNSSFSVLEAKKNGLFERSATWRGYPRRMTYYRALGFILRDEFSDVLKGMVTTEELSDWPNHDEQKLMDSLQRSADDRAEHPDQYVAATVPPAPAHVQTEPAFPEDKGPEIPRPEPPAPEPVQAEAEDDIVMTPTPPAPPPAPPEKPPDMSWQKHVIKSIEHPQFQNKTVAALTPRQLTVVEGQWLPHILEKWDDATDYQKADAKAIQAAIAFNKEEKPW